jgi:hypothetical protein
VLVVTTASPDRDGHELDDLVGCRLRRVHGGFAGNAAAEALTGHFDRVVRTELDHALVFPSGSDLAAYLRAVPSLRHLAERVRDAQGPLHLRYRTSLFVASMPRTRRIAADPVVGQASHRTETSAERTPAVDDRQ